MTTRKTQGPRAKKNLPIGLILTGAVIGAIVVWVAVSQAQVFGGKPPDFPIEMYNGDGVISESETSFHAVLEQGKPVVLNFWAGLCPPCRAEMPGFQRMYDEHGDKFIMLGVDVGVYTGLGSPQAAKDFLNDFNITYPTARALTSPLSDYSVLGMPTTVFITPDGEIVNSHSGFLTEQAALQELTKLLQESGVET